MVRVLMRGCFISGAGIFDLERLVRFDENEMISMVKGAPSDKSFVHTRLWMVENGRAIALAAMKSSADQIGEALEDVW